MRLLNHSASLMNLYKPDSQTTIGLHTNDYRLSAQTTTRFMYEQIVVRTWNNYWSEFKQLLQSLCPQQSPCLRQLSKRQCEEEAELSSSTCALMWLLSGLRPVVCLLSLSLHLKEMRSLEQGSENTAISSLCYKALYRSIKVISTGRRCEQYWSTCKAVLLRIATSTASLADQYWSILLSDIEDSWK